MNLMTDNTLAGENGFREPNYLSFKTIRQSLCDVKTNDMVLC